MYVDVDVAELGRRYRDVSILEGETDALVGLCANTSPY